MRANRDAGICGAGLPAGYCATWPDGGAEARRSLPGVLQASGAYRKDAGASGGARPKHLGNQRQLLLTGPAAPPITVVRRVDPPRPVPEHDKPKPNYAPGSLEWEEEQRRLKIPAVG